MYYYAVANVPSDDMFILVECSDTRIIVAEEQWKI